MTSYAIPGHRKRVKTSAKRRYLIVTVPPYAETWPAVDSSTDDEDTAYSRRGKHARDFPATTWLIIDQDTGEVF